MKEGARCQHRHRIAHFLGQGYHIWHKTSIRRKRTQHKPTMPFDPQEKGPTLKGDLLLVPPERPRCGLRHEEIFRIPAVTWWTLQVSKQVKDQAKALLRKLHNMPPRCSVEGAVHLVLFLVLHFSGWLFLLNQLVCQDPMSNALLSFGSAGAGEFVFHYTMDNGASALIMRLACQIIWRLLLSKIWVLTWNQDLIASGLKWSLASPGVCYMSLFDKRCLAE